MPKQIKSIELEKILQVIEDNPGGLGIREISRESGFQESDRTLRRRLDLLAQEGKIRKLGERKGMLYYPKGEEDRLSGPETQVLSSESKAILEAISKPPPQRVPVGYQQGFLENYIPNKTRYLPESICEELYRAGKVGMSGDPAGTYLRQILQRLLIDLSWNSSRLEGNTYSLLDTKRLLELGEAAEGKEAEETQMILNHKAAIEMLAEDANDIGYNRHTLCNLHALLSDNLLPNSADCGKLRTRQVGISGTVYHPLGVPSVIEENFDLLCHKAEGIDNPYEQALFVMVQMPYLQPFEDVNKRVSRLAANIPLIRHNLCPLAFVDVDQRHYINGILGVYELNRVDYLRDVFIWACKRSAAQYVAIRQSLGEPNLFKLRHRELIGQVVADIVRGKISRDDAPGIISANLPSAYTENIRDDLLRSIMNELQSLHEGNFVRYRLRPSEFAAWKANWE